MFKLKWKEDFSRVCTVYSVERRENGELMFLTFDDVVNRWIWLPISEYIPIDFK